jgi:anti-sigma-K factor RskA
MKKKIRQKLDETKLTDEQIRYVMEEWRKHFGTRNAAAAAADVHPTYWGRVEAGYKSAGPKILQALGVTRK